MPSWLFLHSAAAGSDWKKRKNMILSEAILQENLEEVKRILVETPAVIDETDEFGIPVSFLAAKTGNLPIVKYIVEYSRASMNTFDPQHRNILHFAAMSGNVELVRYLVERVGMSPTAGDRNLETPWQLAHQRKDQAMEDYFASVMGYTLENAYQNPIRTGMFPDPSIVRVGEDYYMVNSSFIFFPCIPISHSRDLVHWKIIGHAITNPEWAGLDELEGGRGYWAPDISYYEGKFYIAATYRLNDTGTVYRRQMVVSSENPQGPYSKPVFIDEDGIDPSIFNDDDGRRYMLLNRGARIFELSRDATRQISEARLLFYGDHKRAPEGPHLLKKDGCYYLFEAEGGTGPGHRVTVSRSRTLFGRYEPCPFNPILRQQDPDAPIQRCGHGKPVCTPDGEWYMVYLCGRMIGEGYSILGRETALDPITWTADGWPIVNGLQGPSVLQKCPALPVMQEIPAEDGLLENGRLSYEWMTPRPPVKDGIVVMENAVLLRGSRLPLTDVGARNILLRRQKDFCFAAGTTLETPQMLPDQEAGLICYYDENTWVSCGILCTQTGYSIQVREHIGEDDRFYFLADLDKKPKILSLSVETRYLERHFYYSIEEKQPLTQTSATDMFAEKQPDTEVCRGIKLEHVYYLCDEGLSRGKRFTGAMVGMYAYAGEQEITVKFTDFIYKRI